MHYAKHYGGENEDVGEKIIKGERKREKIE